MQVVTGTLIATHADLLGAVNNGPGYAAGIASINVDGLTAASSSVPAGSRFKITGDATVYETTAAATITTGAITGLAFRPGLALAVADNAVVTFEVGAEVMQLGGAPVESVVVRVSGIAGGAVLTPEAHLDAGRFGTTWFTVGAAPLTTGTLASTISADGNFRIDTRGLANVRLRVSTAGTGTITTTWALYHPQRR